MYRVPCSLAVAVCVGLPFAALAEKPADKNKPAAPAPAAPAKRVGPQLVTPDQAEKLLSERKDVVVVDVRTEEEFEVGHLAGAQNVSVIDLDFDQKLRDLEGKPVLVHCAAGTRSQRAVEKMMATGKFPEIYHMNGGYRAWTEAGKTVVKTPKAPK